MRTGLALQDARDDFDRARRRAGWAKLAGWLRGRPASRSRLPVLGEVRTFEGAAGPGVRRLEYERIGGLGAGAEATVPIDQIVGTAEPRTCWTACTCWPTIALMAGAGEPSGQLQLKLLGAVVSAAT